MIAVDLILFFQSSKHKNTDVLSGEEVGDKFELEVFLCHTGRSQQSHQKHLRAGEKEKNSGRKIKKRGKWGGASMGKEH